MSNETIKIMPKLRFPEFRNYGEWENKTLGNICFITNGKSNAQDHIENGKYPLYDRSAVIKASNNFIFDCEVVIIPGEGMQFIPKYFIGKFDLHQRAYALKDFTCIGLFVYYSIAVHSKLLAQKAVQSTVLSLRLPILQNFPIQIPTHKKEQQKIADCLSSLDDLITAQKQKLEALKAHKKGLMQQLFPAEGETVPKLRFAEFKNSGDWEFSYIKHVFTIFQGFAFSSSESATEGVRWLKIADVSIQQMNHNSPSFLPIDFKEKYKNFLVKKGDYVIALTRPILSDELKMAQVDDVFNESLLNQRVGKLITNKNIDFVYYLLQTSNLISSIKKAIAGSEPPNLSPQQIENIEIYTPPTKEEQQKIADCLASLDKLITAQQEKIEALKQHKKGLMQALFPCDY